MRLIIEKTKNLDNPYFIIRDLSGYHDIKECIEDIYKRKTNFVPEKFLVCIDTKWYELISNGKGIEQNYNELKQKLHHLPEKFKQLPNDHISIKVNAEEKKLLIDLKGFWW